MVPPNPKAKPHATRREPHNKGVYVLYLFYTGSYVTGEQAVKCTMSIEHRFDIAFVASLAFREKQIQQNYRPIIGVHKWFARRPGTLFRSLLLSEFAGDQLQKTYYSAHDFVGKKIADPFMGGGTPLIEANRIGCDVFGCDVNAMAAWIVREEIDEIDLSAYRTNASKLIEALNGAVGSLYRTDCPRFGDRDVPVKYFMWVKTVPCDSCRNDIDLFPGYLLADDNRHTHNVVVCGSCGELNEVTDVNHPGCCSGCGGKLGTRGPAQRNRCRCSICGQENRYPRQELGSPAHRLFAIEYYNPDRKSEHRGRFFKRPDEKDLSRFAEAHRQLLELKPKFIPADEIPNGDETDRLHRWGYSKYRELFNSRQLLGLEISCRIIAEMDDQRIKRALATNLSDLLRYQNMLCRYDVSALKSLDIFSVHGFPVGLIQCESNILGIVGANGASVGSGGWTNIADKYEKAKKYCRAPFEVSHVRGRKQRVVIRGEQIGSKGNGGRQRIVSTGCRSAGDFEFPHGTLDAVFTDPPYFGNIQYAELMDFCFSWLRQLAGPHHEGFDRNSTRSPEELTVNSTQGRDLAHFTQGLARVFTNMARALKPGAPLVFTYHHNRLEAYKSIGVAILDSGLICSTTFPCPAEMGGSIHIHGTGSSIIDTIFVCRKTGAVQRNLLFETAAQLIAILQSEISQLKKAGVRTTAGDLRCMLYGHLTRMAVWNLP